MKYRFAFYKSKWGDWHLLDNVISLVTWVYNPTSPDASHVEVWLPNEGGRFYAYGYIPGWEGSVNTPDKAFGTMLTSTMRGKDNGTVKRPASEVLKHPERWYYYEVECDEQLFSDALTAAEVKCKNNKGYGVRTLLKFIGINWPDKKRAICSEVAHWFGCITGVIKGKPKIISPRRLSKLLKDMGYERKELV